MPEQFWIDVREMENRLDTFFQQQSKALGRFGSRVNQVFEAFVFAQVVAWHRERGWDVQLVHPPPGTTSKTSVPPEALQESGTTSALPAAAGELRLKFSTRGRPSNYSYAKCSLHGTVVQVRHALRVMTEAGSKYAIPRANVVLDVAVIADNDLSEFSTDTPVPNSLLVTFGEAKHMSAFAELVASFLGLVAEVQPSRLKGRSHRRQSRLGLLPFLYVSGFLTGTAMGLEQTIKKRGFAVDIYTRTEQLAKSLPLAIQAKSSD